MTAQHLTSHSWTAYWEEHGQPWRIEAEIEPARQQLLRKHLQIVADVTKMRFPFSEVALCRADIEWILANYFPEYTFAHQDSVSLSSLPTQPLILDLRGAHLEGINLRALPLPGVRAGLSDEEARQLPAAQRQAAAVHLEGSDLRDAFLLGAQLAGAHLERANLENAILMRANLTYASLHGANLSLAFLQGANLQHAHLEGTLVAMAHLDDANLLGTHFEGSDLQELVQEVRAIASQEHEDQKHHVTHDEVLHELRVALSHRLQAISDEAAEITARNIFHFQDHRQYWEEMQFAVTFERQRRQAGKSAFSYGQIVQILHNALHEEAA